MDIQRAEQIREAFGHCTSVYECRNAEEIVADFASIEESHRTEANWVHIQLSVESIVAERSGCYGEWRDEMEPGVIERLAAIGIDPTQNTW
jgi:hypothetical protein